MQIQKPQTILTMPHSMATEIAINAAFQRAPKSASLIHGGASMTIPQFTDCPNSWCQRVVNM